MRNRREFDVKLEKINLTRCYEVRLMTVAMVTAVTLQNIDQGVVLLGDHERLDEGGLRLLAIKADTRHYDLLYIYNPQQVAW